MRVLFIISDLTFGGAQTQVVEMAREFVRRGDEAAIYTLNSDVPRAPELEGSGVELVVDQKRVKLDPARIAQAVANFQEGGPANDRLDTQKLWYLLAFEMWREKWMSTGTRETEVRHARAVHHQ